MLSWSVLVVLYFQRVALLPSSHGLTWRILIYLMKIALLVPCLLYPGILTQFLEANWMSVCLVSCAPWDKAPVPGSNARDVASFCTPYTPGDSPASSPLLLPLLTFGICHLPHWNPIWASTTAGFQVTPIVVKRLTLLIHWYNMTVLRDVRQGGT